MFIEGSNIEWYCGMVYTWIIFGVQAKQRNIHQFQLIDTGNMSVEILYSWMSMDDL